MIELAPGRIEYLELAGRDDPALVFLHDGLGSVELWRRFPHAVQGATGRRVVAYSRYGHGGSDAPPEPRGRDFMAREAWEILPLVLERLAIVRPLLVGHSDGASIALLHASRHPAAGLVLLAPHVFVEDETLAGVRAARRAFDEGDLGKRMARYHRDPRITFDGWCGVWLDPAFRAWSIEAEVREVTAPTLLVQGESDEYGTLAQLDAIERNHAGRGERLVVPGGHAPHLDQPVAVLAAVSAFVRLVAAGHPT
jgi:pimeloyl-ACP methyl ester carboxylesterase